MPASTAGRQPGLADAEDAPLLLGGARLRSLREIHQLTDRAAIQEQLDLVCEQEMVLDQQLDTEVKDEAAIDAQLAQLHELGQRLRDLRGSSNGLVEILGKTGALAERITRTARQVDLEQRHARAALDLVERVRAVNGYAAAATAALQVLDYEAAAALVQQYLAVAADGPLRAVAEAGASLGRTAAANDSGAVHGSLAALDRIRDELLRVFTADFDAAVAKEDEAALVRAFKMMPLIGHHAVGLEKYGQYVAGAVRRRCEQALRQPTAGRPAYFAEVLLGLFDSVAQMVDQQQPFVEAVYGAGRMLVVIRRLQTAVDAQAAVVVGAFVDKRRVSDMMREAARILRLGGAALAGADEGVDGVLEPPTLDAVLNEWALVSQRIQFYERFMAIRAGEEVRKLAGAEVLQASPVAQDVAQQVEKALADAVEEPKEAYTALERFFVKRSAEKALQIETCVPSTLTTSSLDDVFFVLDKTARRACATRDARTCVQVLSFAARFIENEYLEHLQRALVAVFRYSSSAAAGPAAAADSAREGRRRAATDGAAVAAAYERQDARVRGQVLMNTLDVVSEYVQKVSRESEGAVAEIFGLPLETGALENSGDDNDDEPPHPLAGELQRAARAIGATGEKARSTLKVWLDTFFNQAVRQPVRALLQPVFTAGDGGVATVARFSSQLADLLATVGSAFTARNRGEILARAVDQVSREMETQLFGGTTRLNELGALAWERTLRAIAAQLAALSDDPPLVRERFARLHQIAAVLTLASLESVQEVVQSGGTRLLLADVRRVCRLRSDWKADAIATVR